jgi:hypothetical protein
MMAAKSNADGGQHLNIFPDYASVQDDPAGLLNTGAGPLSGYK